MLSRLNPRDARRERGQVIVLFALLVPVIFVIGSIVMSVGNWYVLKRHLQTQVDAAALAGGPAFTGCAQDPVATNLNIKQRALGYAGDTLRDPATFNLQLQQSGDQRIVLNSSAYWSQGDPTDGSTLDSTLGTPCDVKFLDVKATDDMAPLLWRWIPLFPSLKSRARIEIHKVESTNGLRPLGVPEVDPIGVYAIFVNENGAANSPASIITPPKLLTHIDPLPANDPLTGEGLSVWRGNLDVTFNGSENFGVVIMATRSPGTILTSGTLHDICSQNTTQTHCYAGEALDDGLSFIHSYSDSGSGGPLAAKIRGVELAGGCGLGGVAPSNAYFNLDDGTTCPIIIQAKVDFGVTGNPQGDPTCARVYYDGTTLMSWSNTGGIGTWETSFTPNLAPGGRHQVDLTTKGKQAGSTRTNCSQLSNGPSFSRVAAPYVANDASGPVEYVRLEKTSGGLVNSVNGDPAPINVKVTVGLVPPLRDAALTDPPIPLRIGDNMPNSQALRCSGVNPGGGKNGWALAMEGGCPDPYQVYDQSKHVSPCGNPPQGVPAADPPDCISSKPGNFQQKVLKDIWGSPCSATPNNWDGVTLPDPNDPRWVVLFITDEVAFSTSKEKTYPIRRFGAFYVTAAEGLGCPGDDPDPVPSSAKRSIWGHFVSYVTPGFGDTIPADELCSFAEGGLCVTNLVE